MHTLKKGAPNDYIEVLKRTSSAYRHFSNFMLAYGNGARTVSGEGPSCNLFSMTGDFSDPFVEDEN